jgi:hypothetical protein
MGIVLCPSLMAVTVKDTFMGECCFVHPEDTCNKKKITFMFLCKPLPLLEARMTTIRQEALDFHVMLCVQVMVLEKLVHSEMVYHN